MQSAAARETELDRDSVVALQRLLTSAEGESAVLSVAEVGERLALNPAVRDRAAPHIEALNAALVRLAELHREYDGAPSDELRRAINARAQPLHIEADMHENALHGILSLEQQQRFHAYLAERLAVVGLPADESHGGGTVGTGGNLGGVAHPRKELSGVPDNR